MCRVAALEENLRKVYSVVAMEGGVHMNSIGPAIESQLDSVPLRQGEHKLLGHVLYGSTVLKSICIYFLRFVLPRVVAAVRMLDSPHFNPVFTAIHPGLFCVVQCKKQSTYRLIAAIQMKLIVVD